MQSIGTLQKHTVPICKVMSSVEINITIFRILTSLPIAFSFRIKSTTANIILKTHYMIQDKLHGKLEAYLCEMPCFY